jgi:hypothetical protein
LDTISPFWAILARSDPLVQLPHDYRQDLPAIDNHLAILDDEAADEDRKELEASRLAKVCRPLAKKLTK